jgi:hypothetical protein
MCRTCYDYFGAPSIDTPEVRRLASILPTLAERLRDEQNAWDLQDIVIDKDLMWARWPDREYNYLADMRMLTLAERASVVGLAYGYWVPET